jgi:hypothetical protein
MMSNAPANRNRPPSKGDVAMLKFLAAAELIETDLWEQYCELVSNNDGYREALENIDEAMMEYICDNTDDERSHAAFLNAYLASIGEAPVNFDAFRTLPSVPVTGAGQKGRLTNLRSLNVDTNYYNRYRSPGNPDFGDSFDQIVTIQNRATVPTADGLSDMQLQAAALAAAFHFASIEQGGSSLYINMLLRASAADALTIIASIGPTETHHFAIWMDTLENIFPFDSGDGFVVPDIDEDVKESVMPAPCTFFDAALPLCSVIRPISAAQAGAGAAATFLTNSGLFTGQSQAFFDTVGALAAAADAARHT